MLIKAHISPPILALSDWDAPFQLHTDTSGLAFGAALTQVVECAEGVIG